MTASTPPTRSRSVITNFPAGRTSTRCGVRREIRSKSSSASSTPASWAMASRCSTAFVEPPRAITTAIAFSNASRVMICRGRMSARSTSVSARPLSRAKTSRRASTAGGEAAPGSDIPRASAAAAMVLAVYIPAQDPVVGQAARSIPRSSSSEIVPFACAPTASNTSWIVMSRPS